MSLESVTEQFKILGIDHRIITLASSTATVDEAASEHGVEPGQIAKTLSLRGNDKILLIVVGGDRRIDNKKFKGTFKMKARMLTAEEALEHTGHEIGGICPFGLKCDCDIYLDDSLRQFQEVIPAAGDRHSAIRLTLAELEQFSRPLAWVDVCK